MAWTAPATWSVAEVVTASKLNTHVRDNLKYLKGQAGAVLLEDRMEIPTTSGTTGTGLRFVSGGTGYANLQGFNDGSNSYVFFGTNRQFDGTGWQQLTSRAAGLVQITQDALTYSTFPAASSVPTEWMRINSSGNMGVGVAVPSGRLHVSQAGEITGGGMCVNSVAAVTTIRTIFATASVARAAMFIVFDRNNTGGAVFQTFTSALVSGSTTYTNTDTITIAITAGGAVTVQRTVGTNGTHDILLLALFL